MGIEFKDGIQDGSKVIYRPWKKMANSELKREARYLVPGREYTVLDSGIAITLKEWPAQTFYRSSFQVKI